MKKSNPTYLLIALISVFIAIFIFASKTDWLQQPSLPKTTDRQNIKSKSNLQAQTSADGYTDYTSENFEKHKDKRRVLYFYANWCTTCIPANADFLENSNKIPEDVVVFRVNFRDSDTDETEKQLAEKYKITYQHTFVQVNYSGEAITKWNGGKLQDLIKNIN